MKLSVDGKLHEIDVGDYMPLFWVLHDERGIKHPGLSCGQAL